MFLRICCRAKRRQGKNNGNCSCRRKAPRLTGQWRPAAAKPPYGVLTNRGRCWGAEGEVREVGREGLYDGMPKNSPQAREPPLQPRFLS